MANSSHKITTSEAGRRLGGVCAQRVRDLIRAGELPAERVGDRFVADTRAVERLDVGATTTE